MAMMIMMMMVMVRKMMVMITISPAIADKSEGVAASRGHPYKFIPTWGLTSGV